MQYNNAIFNFVVNLKSKNQHEFILPFQQTLPCLALQDVVDVLFEFVTKNIARFPVPKFVERSKIKVMFQKPIKHFCNTLMEFVGKNLQDIQLHIYILVPNQILGANFRKNTEFEHIISYFVC